MVVWAGTALVVWGVYKRIRHNQIEEPEIVCANHPPPERQQPLRCGCLGGCLIGEDSWHMSYGRECS